MMPARWRRIAELFAGAIRIGPAGIATWPRQACGDDLQAQVGLPLNDDQRAERRGVLGPQEPPGRGLEATAARPAPARPPECRGAHQDDRLRRARIARPPPRVHAEAGDRRRPRSSRWFGPGCGPWRPSTSRSSRSCPPGGSRSAGRPTGRPRPSTPWPSWYSGPSASCFPPVDTIRRPGSGPWISAWPG